MKAEHTAPPEDGVRRTYGDRSTLHGLRYVLLPYATFRRVVWGVIVSLGIILWIYSCSQLIMYYLTYPRDVRVAVIQKYSLRMPQMFVCSKNPLSLTAMVNSGKYEEAVTAFETSNNWVSGASVLGDNLTANVLRAAPKVNETILRIKTMSESVPAIEPTLTMLGQCLVIPPIETRQAGFAGGVKLILNTASYDTTAAMDGEGALQIFLDEAPNRPQKVEEGITISPGINTKLYLKETSHSRLMPPYGACGGQRHTSCLSDCRDAIRSTKCVCSPFYKSDDRVATCSTPEQLACETTLQETSAMCDCPIPCQDTWYDVRERREEMTHEQTMQRMLGDVTSRMLRTKYDAAQNASLAAGLPPIAAFSLRSTVAQLSVGFERMELSMVTEVVAFSLSDLLQQLGIHLAIILGASIISVVELLDLLLVSLIGCCRKDT